MTACPKRNSKSVNDVFLSKIKDKNLPFRVNRDCYYPSDFFCPISSTTTIMTITDNTYSIHHFAGTWVDKKTKDYSLLRKKLIKKYGVKLGANFARLLYCIKHPIFMIKKSKMH